MELTSEQRAQIQQLMMESDELAVVRYLQNTFKLSAEESLLLAEKLKAEYEAQTPSMPQHIFVRMRSGKAPNVGKIVGSVFLGFGLIMLTVVSYLIYSDFTFQQRAIPITGTLVDFETSYSTDDDGGSTLMYAGIYEYEYNGKKYKHYSNTSSSSPPGQTGEQVEVLLDPDDPSRVTINTFGERWTLVLILGILGTIFTVVGYFVRKALSATSVS